MVLANDVAKPAFFTSLFGMQFQLFPLTLNVEPWTCERLQLS